MPVTRRRTSLAAACAFAVLAVAGCNGGEDAGSGPTPFEDDSSGTPSSPATSSTPTSSPTRTTTTPTPSRRGELVLVDPGKYATNGAVVGFTRAIREFYRARQAHRPGLMNGWASTIFYTDNEAGILLAKSRGLVMRPPGKIVVRTVRKGPLPGSVTVEACFGPTMAWYDPKKRKYTADRPNGSPIAMDLTKGVESWQLFEAHNAGFSCDGVKYPAG